MKNNKLYLVKLRGLTSPTDVELNKTYVVAKDPTEAYEKIRTWLDDKDYGFAHEREMESIELIAEDYEFTDVKTMLFL